MKPTSIATLIWMVVITAVISAFLTALVDSGDAGVPDVTPRRALAPELTRVADAHWRPSAALRVRDAAHR